MNEPPNTETAMATVREALTMIRTTSKNEGFTNILGFEAKASVALDAIASELDELPGLWRAVKESARRAEAAEAELEQVKRDAEALNARLLIEKSDALVELERVRAERDEWEASAARYNDAQLPQRIRAEQAEARLDRAVEALRAVVHLPDETEAYSYADACVNIARAALAEIEESG